MAHRGKMHGRCQPCRASGVVDRHRNARRHAAALVPAHFAVCEVLSPSTETLDRGKKLRRYAHENVAHVWLVDPVRQMLEVLALRSGSWAVLAVHEGGAGVRAAPFDAIELELGELWIRRG